jgi:hypothetical protein
METLKVLSRWLAFSAVSFQIRQELGEKTFKVLYLGSDTFMS